jgi:NAD(P)-dependent dehydrogenase (short-subunit alcohol dehydrogenase family)
MRGRTIVLTGATRGLGRALADELARRGHRVLGCGRSVASAGTLRNAGTGRDAGTSPGKGHDAGTEPARGVVHLARVDVADAAAVAAWAEHLLATVGPPDLVLNNAGLMNDPAPLWEVPAGQFERLLAVNVTGVVHVIRAFVPAMIAAGAGVVVNLSSGWGRVTSPHVAPYCASKWAIEGLTRALAQELPPGLAAVSLNPGIIDTDMLRQAWADGASGFESPDAWAPRAADLVLGLGPDDSGAALTV